jgi:hypothetical protein
LIPSFDLVFVLVQGSVLISSVIIVILFGGPRLGRVIEIPLLLLMMLQIEHDPFPFPVTIYLLHLPPLHCLLSQPLYSLLF